MKNTLKASYGIKLLKVALKALGSEGILVSTSHKTLLPMRLRIYGSHHYLHVLKPKTPVQDLFIILRKQKPRKKVR